LKSETLAFGWMFRMRIDIIFDRPMEVLVQPPFGTLIIDGKGNTTNCVASTTNNASKQQETRLICRVNSEIINSEPLRCS